MNSKQINELNQRNDKNKVIPNLTNRPWAPVVYHCQSCQGSITYLGKLKRTICDTCIHRKVKLGALNRQQIRQGVEVDLWSRFCQVVGVK